MRSLSNTVRTVPGSASPPRSRQSTPTPPLPRMRRIRRRVGWSALAVAVAALVLGLLVAPPDALQGQAQRLMYVHVPAALTGYLALALVAVCSVLVLLGGGPRCDALARAGADLAVPMLGLTIVVGSIWGHSAWGVWWAWDPRLTTAALLWLTYVGYLALRWAGPDPATTPSARRRLAVLGAVAFLEVPVVHFSVLWWRSLHQPPTLLRPSLSDPIAGSMLLALLVALLAFVLAGAWFVLSRFEQVCPSSPAPRAADPRPAPRRQAPVSPLDDRSSDRSSDRRSVAREPSHTAGRDPRSRP